MKVFDTYGIKGERICNCNHFCHYLENRSTLSDLHTYLVYKDNCNLTTKQHQPITAEKREALEEVIRSRFEGFWFGINPANVSILEYSTAFYINKENLTAKHRSGYGKTRLEALCQLLIKLHEHFSDDERAAVKRILEG